MIQRIAIVAGGGGGLGQTTVSSLLSAGLTVVAMDRDKSLLSKLPADVHGEVADSTDPTAAKTAIDRIASDIGPPDILVNTIGAYELGAAVTVTPETLQNQMNINVGPALWLTQAVAPHMQKKGSGVIVHVAARQGIDALAGAAAYSISKAALVHLTRILDVELRPQGIRVNAVLPQLIDTPKNREILPPNMLAGAVAPELIASLIAFLVSDSSAAVSGAVVPAYGP